MKVAQYFSAGYGSMIVFPSRWDDRIVSPPGLAGLQFSVVRKVAFEGRTFFNRPIPPSSHPPARSKGSLATTADKRGALG